MARPKTRYIASLDGLRSFAVLAVIAYHMGFFWAPGGLLGVTVFFVLSGYLITGLLISEFHSSRTIDLPQFWLRRVRRLVPAIIAVVVVTCALCVLFNHDLLTKMRPDIIPSLLFYSNWWQIFHDVSYFAAQGAPSPLQHFWSLAIEEQFYLVWPVLLLLLFKRRTSFKWLKRGILIAAAASALWMAVLYNPEGDPSRVYYGTDTRAFSLLIGAWLAIVWPSTAFGDKRKPDALPSLRARRVFDGIGVLAFVGLIALVATANGYTPFLYRGGLVICSILTAVLIAVIIRPDSTFAKLWSLPPLVWVGKRSYGMYLWHFPILLLMTNQNATEAAPLWWNALEFAVILVVSALSYRFVENPVRQGKLGAWFRGVRDKSVNIPRTLAKQGVPAAVCCVVLAVAVIGCVAIPPSNAVEDPAYTQTSWEDTQQKATEAAAKQTVYDVLMIGDSVAARCENSFSEFFPHGYLDAAIGRSFSQGLEMYDYFQDLGIVGNTIVVALGTNNLVTSEQLEAFMSDVGPDKRIYLVNTRSNEEWVDATNEALAQAAAGYDNVELIDWHTYSAGNEALFAGDGKHLSPDGARAYLALIKDNIKSSA